MEQRGQLTRWNDAKGFGFIQPEAGGAPVFVHISALRGAQRPQPGEQVLFVAGNDSSGRPRAEHMRLPQLCLDRPAIRRKPRDPVASVRPPVSKVSRRQTTSKTAGIQHLSVKLLVLAALVVLPLSGSLQLLFKYALSWPLYAYAGVSLLSVAQYWQDKQRAQQGRWRIPEHTLQVTALLGGWPGALVAQHVFRHKTRKLEFQLPFWLIVLAHQVFWLDWLLLQGRYLGAPLHVALGL
jgi:uncharacterized membrane protein YsdA (DUF1294 family)/cold shock CspA family protein